jgi:predicted ABC-class ATPase
MSGIDLLDDVLSKILGALQRGRQAANSAEEVEAVQNLDQLRNGIEVLASARNRDNGNIIPSFEDKNARAFVKHCELQVDDAFKFDKTLGA